MPYIQAPTKNTIFNQISDNQIIICLSWFYNWSLKQYLSAYIMFLRLHAFSSWLGCSATIFQNPSAYRGPGGPPTSQFCSCPCSDISRSRWMFHLATLGRFSFLLFYVPRSSFLWHFSEVHSFQTSCSWCSCVPLPGKLHSLHPRKVIIYSKRAESSSVFFSPTTLRPTSCTCWIKQLEGGQASSSSEVI